MESFQEKVNEMLDLPYEMFINKIFKMIDNINNKDILPIIMAISFCYCILYIGKNDIDQNLIEYFIFKFNQIYQNLNNEEKFKFIETINGLNIGFSIVNNEFIKIYNKGLNKWVNIENNLLNFNIH